MDLIQLWADVVSKVSEGLTDVKDKTIIGLLSSQTSIQLQDDKVIFICNSDFVFKLFRKYVSFFYEEVLHLLGNENLGMEIKLISPSSVHQASQAQHQSAVHESRTAPKKSDPVTSQQSVSNQNSSFVQNQSQDRNLPDFLREDHINPNKTFDNYITDPENLLIVTIAQQIASNPGGSSTNPFYIYGKSGLGKTHILFAIANSIRKNHPEMSIVYTRAEEFIHNYVASMVREKNSYQRINFQNFFSQQDVFIVDDIQNFIKSPAARDTFFEIIADFLDKSNRQLILASDVPPGNLKDFNPRLTSRFGAGICREIYAPGQETRAAITIKKCRELNMTLPDSVIEYISNNIRSSVREIEGAIKTLNSHLMVYGSITYDDAVKSLSSLVNVKSQLITVDMIKERVTKEFEVSVSSLESAERTKNVSRARSFAMALINDLIPSLSLNDIGRAFNKDHSSVHQAIKRIKEEVAVRQETAALFQKLTLSLKK